MKLISGVPGALELNPVTNCGLPESLIGLNMIDIVFYSMNILGAGVETTVRF